MKLLITKDVLTGVLIFAMLVFSGCRDRPDAPSQTWTQPVNIAESWDGIIGSAGIFRYNQRIVALIPQRGGLDKCLLLNHGNVPNNSWTEVPITGVPHDYFCVFSSSDQSEDRMWFQMAKAEDDRLTIGFIPGSLANEPRLRIETERKWTFTRKSLLGEAGANVSLSEPLLGRGIMVGSEIYVPYCFNAVTQAGNTQARSHFNSGVFRSDDSGKTWRMERISDFHSGGPKMSRTTAFYYFFAVKYPGPAIWFSRKPIDVSQWGTTQEVSSAYAKGIGGHVTQANGDTVHICWLDSRHEKSRFDLQAPYQGNYEVVYCRRRDSDAAWCKDIILSKGVFYSYSPSMSVEGDRIVIAWAGFKAASDRHGENRPNDIYCVTSKDAGITWTKPSKVTDSANDGITSAKPQVVLLNGVVHIVYVQGKLNFRQESPGLVKLNQPPWPIYYQQRPFPN